MSWSAFFILFSVNLKFNSGIRVLGGALEDNYRVGGVHFHWGNSDAVGSEHKVDGHPFPLEVSASLSEFSIYIYILIPQNNTINV